jgi:predicted acylesterase/phospholipase RssA
VLVAGRPSPPPGGPVHPAETGADLVLEGEVSRAQLVAWHDAYEPRSSCVLRGTAGLASGLLSLGARVSGRSIGLTLGGGGARAFAHIGVLEELDARGIQVDRVSGTSMGALIGALYARGLGADAINAAVYEAFVRRNPLSDYTVPRQSLSRGRKTMRELERAFGGELIEELAKEFRCVSVDLLRRTPVVHARGQVVDAVAASLRLPGLFAPYPLNGSLHIDGGVLDNLPVGALRTGEGPVIAVSIPSAIARDASGPQGAAPQIPGLVETLLRVMMLSSENTAEAARADADLVITPDTSGFGLLDFRRIDLIREAGRAATRAALASPGSEETLARGSAQPM